MKDMFIFELVIIMLSSIGFLTVSDLPITLLAIRAGGYPS
jgi:hypothetical protein